MMVNNAMGMVEKVEQNFMPGSCRIIIKLSKEHLFCHGWPDSRIWHRGDGVHWRDMHTLNVLFGSERFGTNEELITALWNGLVKHFGGTPLMFAGPFGSSEWRPAVRIRDVVWVKFGSHLAFGSNGIMKNSVWRCKEAPEDKQEW